MVNFKKIFALNFSDVMVVNRGFMLLTAGLFREKLQFLIECDLFDIETKVSYNKNSINKKFVKK